MGFFILNYIIKYIKLVAYDAWGNSKIYVLNGDNFVDVTLENSYNEDSNEYINVATTNPFRYRGYYYDTETNLYYLNSRYYDPELVIFINIDDISVLLGVHLEVV